MTALHAKAAPKIADVLRMLYERHRISALARRYGDEARLESKVALELDVVLEEVSLCLQVPWPTPLFFVQGLDMLHVRLGV